MRIVFPGTFDPITLGHEALIRRIASVFDEIVIGVAAGVHKSPFFTLEERLELTISAFADDSAIHVHPFNGLLVQFMAEQQSNIIVRGIRAISDFEFESQIADINHVLNKQIETVFFLPDRDYIFLSSSIVREVAILGGDVSELVSPMVAQKLQTKLNLK